MIKLDKFKFTTSIIAMIINVTALYIHNQALAVTLVIVGTTLATVNKS